MKNRDLLLAMEVKAFFLVESEQKIIDTRNQDLNTLIKILKVIITVRDRESERRKQQRQMESSSQPQHVIIMKEVYYYTQRMIMVKRQARTS